MRSTQTENFYTIQRFLEKEIIRKKELQEMAELASFICQTPIAMINLIDRDKHHIKFKVGTNMNEMIKEDTFCQYISSGSQMMIIPNALKDQRFYDNPLVVNAPFIRFYAGMPLITQSGITIGSICVMGRVPKDLTSSQKQRMRVLCKRVVEMLELELSLVA